MPVLVNIGGVHILDALGIIVHPEIATAMFRVSFRLDIPQKPFTRLLLDGLERVAR